jgi:hypothetical protein
MVTGYCVKCKEKGVQMQSPAIHKTKKGGYMAKGGCPACGTVICAMMSEQKAQEAIASGAEKAY